MSITVYTKTNCVQCDFTKRELKNLGVEYDEADVTTEENLEYVKTLGHLAAPVVVTGGGEHWSGFRPDLLREYAGTLVA